MVHYTTEYIIAYTQPNWRIQSLLGEAINSTLGFCGVYARVDGVQKLLQL
jgi:hypothetical protein